MSALNDRHVQFWLVLLLVVVVLFSGVYVGTRFATTTNTTVYEYEMSLPSETGEAVTLQYGAWPALERVDFFTRVRDTFITERAHFVEANLTSMELRVYREGAVVLTVPIKSKGREGSWWETPAGLYKAEGKRDNHFSSFGHVNMPWSIPFQGNFFIHGWPYYPDGTRVATSYSGGCIRLEDEYARQVYDLVEVGMPILVYEEENQHASAPPYVLHAPDVGASSYLVADLDTNFLLLGSETDVVRESNIPVLFMTALVASEHQNIEGVVTVPHDIYRGVATTSRFLAGSTYSLYDLFFPLLQEASYDSATIIAEHFGATRFTNLLSSRARAIGMQHATLTALGADTKNTTTAEDMFLLMRYLRQNRSFLLALSAGTVDTRIYGTPSIVGVTPRHPLSLDTGFVGGIYDDGFSKDAHETVGNEAAVLLVFATSTSAYADQDAHTDLVAVFNVTFESGVERAVAFIVLDSPDPARDTRTMMSYITTMYQ